MTTRWDKRSILDRCAETGETPQALGRHGGRKSAALRRNKPKDGLKHVHSDHYIQTMWWNKD